MGSSSSKYSSSKNVKINKYSGQKKFLNKDKVLNKEKLSKFNLATLNDLLKNHLEANRNIEFFVNSSPFFEREEFLYYKGYINNNGNKEDKVFKLSKDGNNRLTEEVYLASIISSYLAFEYTKVLNYDLKVEYNEPSLIYLKDSNGNDKIYMMEDFRSGVFFKFTDISRVILERKPQHWSEIEKLLVDFSHWTYSWTNENLMVVNLQGWWKDQKNCMLTDPGVRFKEFMLGKPEWDIINNRFIEFLNSHKDICCSRIWQTKTDIYKKKQPPLQNNNKPPPVVISIEDKKPASEPRNLAKKENVVNEKKNIPINNAAPSKLNEFKNVMNNINAQFDRLTKVLISMEISTLNSLLGPFNVVKDMQKDLNVNTNIEKLADDVLDMLLETYDTIYDKYKNTDYTMNEDNQKKLYYFNDMLNFMCEMALVLYESYSSKQQETVKNIINMISDSHMKLKFEDKVSFMRQSLPKYNMFINNYGSEQDIQDFREIRERNFPGRSNLIYDDKARQENANVKRIESVRSDKALSPQKQQDQQPVDVEKLMNSLVIELMKANSAKEEASKVIPKCSLCKSSDFIAYMYRCLVCESFNVCSTCFENRKSNETHSSSHPVVRCDEKASLNLFGVKFTNETLNLSTFEDVFKNEVHTNIKCGSCQKEPIKGLCFKCDACYDYHVCLDCYKKKSESKHHVVQHPLIAIGKTESLVIKKNEIQLIGDPLGSGAFGTVYKAKYLPQNKIVACKIIKYDVIKLMLGFKPDDMVNSFLRELNAFKEVKGDNVHRLIGHSETPNVRGPGSSSFELMIITEFMEKGSLASLLNHEPDLSYRKRLHIATGICSGMSRIHDLSFIHRDIRPDNILIDGNYTAKIADMGIAKLYENNMKMTAIGCRDYMPPEFYTGRYSKKLDIYTYGLTLNEIFNGVHRLIQRSREIVIEREADVFYHIVKVCISKDERDRPEAKLLEKELTVFENCIDSAISKNLYSYFKNKNEFFKDVYNKALIAYRSTSKQYIENKF